MSVQSFVQIGPPLKEEVGFIQIYYNRYSKTINPIMLM